jgi:hypothetical protein
VFDGQDAATCSDLIETEEHQLAYQEFRNQYRCAVTSRNRYLTLYDTVSLQSPEFAPLIDIGFPVRRDCVVR